MKDSTPDIIRKQLEIILSKSESDRFRLGDDLNAFGRKVLEGSIRQEFPLISEIDLKTEVFKRAYASFFSPDELNRIILSMQAYFRKEQHGI